jgi:dihydroflavonol-4-reductase
VRVLVTGATGFIGSHVVPALLARGHVVRALVRPGSSVAGLTGEVEIARGELGGARAALEGMEGLVHLAGVSGALLRRGEERTGELWRVNVEGTRRLFAAAADSGLRRGVHVTSLWTVLRPELASISPYIASRVESERAAFSVGGEVCCVCPTFVVGAGDRGPNFPGAIVRAVVRGQLVLAPPGGMTWIGVEDAAAAIVSALERGEPRARYVIGAEHVAHRALLTRVARIAARRPPLGTLPPVRVLGAAGALIDATLGLARRRFPIPLRVAMQLLSLDEPIDCRDSWRALGEPRVPLDDALAAAVAWFAG